MTNNKEMKKVIEKVVDKILVEKKKEKEIEKKKKLEEQKKRIEEQKQIETFKSSLHGLLKPIEWDKLTISEAKELVSKLEKWVKENKQ